MDKKKTGELVWYAIGTMTLLALIGKVLSGSLSSASGTSGEQIGSAFGMSIVLCAGVSMLLSLLPVPWLKDKNHAIAVGFPITMIIILIAQW